MKLDRKSLLLYAVTDRFWLNDRSTLSRDVESALKGGVTCVQLREKNLDSLLLEETLLIKELCRSYDVPFIINDNVEFAVKCKADGVHIGQNDMPADRAREIIGPEMILGVSVKNTSQAVKAERCGADYLGVGAIFHTDSKKDAAHVCISDLRSICESVSIPVVAIGGINKNNVFKLAGSKIDGIAVISAIFAQNDIRQAASELYVAANEVVNS